MKRSVGWVLAIVILQATLLGIYWLVEHQRNTEPSGSLETGPPRHVNLARPSLNIRQRDGRKFELQTSSQPTLVHIWATWCPPCRAELPGLLQLADEYDVSVVAIALDQSWPDVDRFLAGINAASVFLGDSDEIERALGVNRLPVTFLLQADGRITLRFDGARDWTDETFVKAYLEDAIRDRQPLRRAP